MEKYRAIPQGYMTVGELAKKGGTTVRTLQYYDKEGLLAPSAESEGKRRLYTDKDMIQLYQIQTLKSLGFSLDDIKNRLTSLDTPADVAEALSVQADDIREKIQNLSASLGELEALREEVLLMNSVDFKKYADIIVNLQMKNQFYKLIKHFDERTLDHFRNRFDKESCQAVMKDCNLLFHKALELQQAGISPESEQGIAFAKDFWEMITVFTDGKPELLADLMKTTDQLEPNDEFNKIQQEATAFIGPALGAYFESIHFDPTTDRQKQN